VVDDGSTDETPSVAARMSVSVVALAENSGPAAARNEGAVAPAAPFSSSSTPTW